MNERAHSSLLCVARGKPGGNSNTSDVLLSCRPSEGCKRPRRVASPREAATWQPWLGRAAWSSGETHHALGGHCAPPETLRKAQAPKPPDWSALRRPRSLKLVSPSEVNGATATGSAASQRWKSSLGSCPSVVLISDVGLQ